MAYGRHESFYLRNNWISKGLKHVENNPHFFYDKDNFEKIGLGKNMVKSLRFWLTAIDLIEENNKEHTITEFGKIIYSKDRLLEKDSTLMMLQYKLLKNPNDIATVFNWFFTIFDETIVEKTELKRAFKDYVKSKEQKEISEKSLDRDIDVLIQLYTKKANEKDPEDIIFSPLTRLGLIKEEHNTERQDIVVKSPMNFTKDDLTGLYFILLDYAYENNIEYIEIEEIMSSSMLWGNLFNMSKLDIADVLAVLANHKTYPLEYVRTNNLDNVKLPKVNPYKFLENEFNE